jgi:hypothetical protein
MQNHFRAGEFLFEINDEPMEEQFDVGQNALAGKSGILLTPPRFSLLQKQEGTVSGEHLSLPCFRMTRSIEHGALNARVHCFEWSQ